MKICCVKRLRYISLNGLFGIHDTYHSFDLLFTPTDNRLTTYSVDHRMITMNEANVLIFLCYMEEKLMRNLCMVFC